MLKVSIFSFSYLYNGIPSDDSGNGGGFVLDCRFIENPGRIEEFRNLTGLDDKVAEFLENHKPMQDFLSNVYNIIDAAVENYTHRGFTNLMVSFGCTGGRHRSVYSAQKLSDYIISEYPFIKTAIHHCNLKD
ncbi:ATP-binding protein [bacterium]|nr:MAG: ATP-binding protein [bacterium]